MSLRETVSMLERGLTRSAQRASQSAIGRDHTLPQPFLGRAGREPIRPYVAARRTERNRCACGKRDDLAEQEGCAGEAEDSEDEKESIGSVTP